jgi:hypothetical protein
MPGEEVSFFERYDTRNRVEIADDTGASQKTNHKIGIGWYGEKKTQSKELVHPINKILMAGK